MSDSNAPAPDALAHDDAATDQNTGDQHTGDQVSGDQNEASINTDGSRRDAVRLTTVFGGRVCQYGKAYACIISDVSAGGAKVRLKDPNDFIRITQAGEAQLIFERLSDYKALNCVVAWLRPKEHAVGLRFIDSELRRRVVMKRLMPTRWRIAHDQADSQVEVPEIADSLEGNGEG